MAHCPGRVTSIHPNNAPAVAVSIILLPCHFNVPDRAIGRPMLTSRTLFHWRALVVQKKRRKEKRRGGETFPLETSATPKCFASMVRPSQRFFIHYYKSPAIHWLLASLYSPRSLTRKCFLHPAPLAPNSLQTLSLY